MKILVLLVLISVSQSEASTKSNRAISPRAPNMSAAQMLNWEQFKVLPVEKKIQYFEVIKQFLLEQEAKWPGKKVASIFDFFPSFVFPEAEASEGCPELELIPKDRKDVIKAIGTYGDYCIKAGYLICISYTQGKLKCDSTDTAYLSYSKKYCKDPTKQVACSPPLFIGTDNNAICVEKAESRRLKSVTQACINKQKSLGMDDATYKAAVLKAAKGDKFKPSYETLKKSITDYCTPANGKRWTFDEIDCGGLTAQLAKVDPSYDGMAKTWAAKLAKAEAPPANKPAAEVKELTQPSEEKVPAFVKCKSSSYTIPAWKDIKDDQEQVIKLQFNETDDDKYSVAAQDRKGWVTSECDGNGRINHQSLDALKTRIAYGYDDDIETGVMNENYAPCMVKISRDQVETLHFEGKSKNDRAECGIHLTRYQDGAATAESKCSVPAIEGYSFQVKKDDSGVFSVGGSTGSLVKSATGPGPIFYQVQHEAGKPFRQIFYAPAATASGDPLCYASVMDVIGPQTTVAAGAAPAPAETTTTTPKASAK